MKSAMVSNVAYSSPFKKNLSKDKYPINNMLGVSVEVSGDYFKTKSKIDKLKLRYCFLLYLIISSEGI